MPHIQIQQPENLPKHQVSILIMAKAVVLKYSQCEYTFLIYINSVFCVCKHQMTIEKQSKGPSLLCQKAGAQSPSIPAAAGPGPKHRKIIQVHTHTLCKKTISLRGCRAYFILLVMRITWLLGGRQNILAPVLNCDSAPILHQTSICPST